jgi:hypothetical protein
VVVAAQGCRIVTAMIAASNANEKVVVFIGWILSFSRLVNSAIAGLKEGKKLSGEAPSPGFRSWFKEILQKISPTCQINLPQARTADSSSKNAVCLSSARATKRFPSPQCAPTTKIVRPLESRAETQPKLQPYFLRLSAMISQCFTGRSPPV